MGRIIVRSFNIAGTARRVFQAWEPIEGPFAATHSTITHDDEHGWLGRVGTRRGGDYEGLPVGPERSAAVDRHYADQHREALEAIYAAHPELLDRDDRIEGAAMAGEVEVTS